MGRPLRTVWVALVASELVFVAKWLRIWARLSAPDHRAPEGHDGATAQYQFARVLDFIRLFSGSPALVPKLQSYISDWFYGAPWHQLKLGNLEEHVARSFFYKSREELLAAGLGPQLRQMVMQLAETAGISEGEMEEGYSPGLKAMWHLNEPMRVQYRPLAFYGVMEGLALVSRGVLCSLGFHAAQVPGCTFHVLGLPLPPTPARSRAASFSRSSRATPAATATASTATAAAATLAAAVNPTTKQHAEGVGVRDVTCSSCSGADERQPGTGLAPLAGAQSPRTVLRDLAARQCLKGAPAPVTPAAAAASLSEHAVPMSQADTAHTGGCELGCSGTTRGSAGEAGGGMLMACGNGASHTSMASSQQEDAVQGHDQQPSRCSPRQQQQQQPSVAAGRSTSAPTALPADADAIAAAAGMDADAGLPPILFLHGVGVGLLTYLHVVARVAADARAVGQAVIVPEFPHVSMRLCRQDSSVESGSSVPTAEEAAASVVRALDALGVKKVCVVAHSYGTFVASRLVQSQPHRIASLALIDPVCFGMFLPHLLHNFIYAPPRNDSLWHAIKDRFVRFAAREVHIAATFCRKFYWTSVQLDLEQLPPSSMVVIGGCDELLHGQELADAIRTLQARRARAVAEEASAGQPGAEQAPRYLDGLRQVVFGPDNQDFAVAGAQMQTQARQAGIIGMDEAAAAGAAGAVSTAEQTGAAAVTTQCSPDPTSSCFAAISGSDAATVNAAHPASHPASPPHSASLTLTPSASPALRRSEEVREDGSQQRPVARGCSPQTRGPSPHAPSRVYGGSAWGGLHESEGSPLTCGRSPTLGASSPTRARAASSYGLGRGRHTSTANILAALGSSRVHMVKAASLTNLVKAALGEHVVSAGHIHPHGTHVRGTSCGSSWGLDLCSDPSRVGTATGTPLGRAPTAPPAALSHLRHSISEAPLSGNPADYLMAPPSAAWQLAAAAGAGASGCAPAPEGTGVSRTTTSSSGGVISPAGSRPEPQTRSAAAARSMHMGMAAAGLTTGTMGAPSEDDVDGAQANRAAGGVKAGPERIWDMSGCGQWGVPQMMYLENMAHADFMFQRETQDLVISEVMAFTHRSAGVLAHQARKGSGACGSVGRSGSAMNEKEKREKVRALCESCESVDTLRFML